MLQNRIQYHHLLPYMPGAGVGFQGLLLEDTVLYCTVMARQQARKRCSTGGGSNKTRKPQKAAGASTKHESPVLKYVGHIDSKGAAILSPFLCRQLHCEVALIPAMARLLQFERRAAEPWRHHAVSDLQRTSSSAAHRQTTGEQHFH